MIVKVVHFDTETSAFVTVAVVNGPEHQLGFNKNPEKDACEYAFARTQNIFGSWSRGPTYEDGEHNEDYSENVQVIEPLPRDGFGRAWGRVRGRGLADRTDQRSIGPAQCCTHAAKECLPRPRRPTLPRS